MVTSGGAQQGPPQGEQEGGWILLYQPYEAFAMRSDIRWNIPTALRPYSLNFRAGQISVGSRP